VYAAARKKRESGRVRPQIPDFYVSEVVRNVEIFGIADEHALQLAAAGKADINTLVAYAGFRQLEQLLRSCTSTPTAQHTSRIDDSRRRNGRRRDVEASEVRPGREITHARAS